MPSYIAITTCNAEQWRQYACAMVSTFMRHWPTEVEFWLYPEGFGRPEADLHIAAPWLVDFKQRYRVPEGRYNRNDYRRDAVRFSHKVAAIGAAAESVDRDVLIWMDADIVTHSQVTIEWLDSLFPEPATVAWLDRSTTYPECGFMMFRMPDAKRTIGRVVAMYQSGDIFKLAETHDSYVFQHVVNAARSRGEVVVHSLSGSARSCTGHPFVNSRLGECMDHLKGDLRKAQRKSFAHDLHRPRPEPYWNTVRSSRAS